VECIANELKKDCILEFCEMVQLSTSCLRVCVEFIQHYDSLLLLYSQYCTLRTVGLYRLFLAII